MNAPPIHMTVPPGFARIDTEPDLPEGEVLYHGALHVTAGDRIAAASLLVTSHPADDFDPHRLLLETARDDTPVQILPVPSGQAVVSFYTERFAVDDGRVTVASVRAVLPLPGRGCRLVFVLATPILADWETYCHMMVHTLRSVRVVT